MTYESLCKFYDISNTSENIIRDYLSIPLEYYNPDDSKESCVERAISKLINKDIAYVREELNKYTETLNNGYLYNEKENYGSFIESKFKASKLKNLLIIDNMNGYMFCKTFTKGKFLVRSNNHVYPVIDGVAYDCWNPLGEIITDL